MERRSGAHSRELPSHGQRSGSQAVLHRREQLTCSGRLAAPQPCLDQEEPLIRASNSLLILPAHNWKHQAVSPSTTIRPCFFFKRGVVVLHERRYCLRSERHFPENSSNRCIRRASTMVLGGQSRPRASDSKNNRSVSFRTINRNASFFGRRTPQE